MRGRGHTRVDREPDHVESLVRRAQAGDTLAINDLLDLVGPYVGRLCAGIALQDAADAAQEALIVVFLRIKQLREPAALFGWVRSIAVREAIRVAGRGKAIPSSELADVAGPSDAHVAVDIDDILTRLSPDHRAVLVLRDIEDLDEAAVASILGISPGTVKSRLSRARRNFREEWG